MQPRAVDLCIFSLIIFIPVGCRKYIFTHSEHTVRDHEFRLFIKICKECVLQSRNAVRNHQGRFHSRGNYHDHVPCFAGDKSAQRRVILILLIYVKSFCQDHIKRVRSDMPDIGPKMHTIHMLRFFAERIHQIVTESHIAYALKRVRKLEGAQVCALHKCHVSDRFKRLGKRDIFYLRLRESAVAYFLCPLFNRVLAACRIGILDEGFPVFAVQNAANSFVVRIIVADRYLLKFRAS